MMEHLQGKHCYSKSIIDSIEVDDLFYSYNYRLNTTNSAGLESSRLMLLYGNNGAGKTTILNLVYHLLHPEPYDGHRSFIGRVPFRRFQVNLSDGISVAAQRCDSSEPGSYQIQVCDSDSEERLQWTWNPDRNSKYENDHAEYDALCSFLSKLNITLHFLRDTRRLEAVQSRVIRRLHRTPDGENVIIEEDDSDDTQSHDKLIQRSIESAVQWFRQKALSATNVGYTSVNSIYRDLIKRVVTPGVINTKGADIHIDELVNSLINLKGRNSYFSKFGLTSELDIDDIVSSLRACDGGSEAVLNTILETYLDGNNARLDALEELHDVMNSFISLLAEFYSHKDVNIHLETGLDIHSDTGIRLLPQMLSSGEQQLLLLFCNAIVARKDRTILIIDEPEISLNVTWQRRLIPALLTCMSGTNFQMIIATHSIELLSQYHDSVTPLDNQDINNQ